MVTHFLITSAIRLLEAFFFLGLVGSALVIIIAGLEDVREIFKEDKPQQDEVE